MASILRMSWHQLKACVPHRPVRARYSDFAICSCGGISQICQWYRVCDAGALALAGRALSHPSYLARSLYGDLSKLAACRSPPLREPRLRAAVSFFLEGGLGAISGSSMSSQAAEGVFGLVGGSALQLPSQCRRDFSAIVRAGAGYVHFPKEELEREKAASWSCV